MKKAVVAGLALLLAAETCAAEGFEGSIGYTSISDDDDGIDVTLGAITGSVGYRWDMTNAFSVIPTLRVGFGVNDDKVNVIGTRVDVELDSFVALSVRGEYLVNDAFYVFAQPSYAEIDLEAKAFGSSISDRSGEFGLGAGAGYKFGNAATFEVSYEHFDGANVLTGGLRLHF